MYGGRGDLGQWGDDRTVGVCFSDVVSVCAPARLRYAGEGGREPPSVDGVIESVVDKEDAGVGRCASACLGIFRFPS